MPFGLIYGALFFGLLCGSIGLRWLVQPAVEAKIGGLLLAVLGAALALGLLMRRNWARWAGVLVGALLTLYGLRHLASGGDVLDHLLPFAAFAAALLLAIPVTGEPIRGASPRVAAASREIGPVGWTALVSFLGLLVVGMTTGTDVPPGATPRDGALPAAAIDKRIRWSGFDDGLQRAREEGKPILATFVTDWCPYCTKMARKTWRAPSVVERLSDVVAVRVDVESEAGPGGGTPGHELAARYAVSGFPVQMVIDPQGRVVARYDGYQSSRELLTWLDGVPDARPAGNPAATLAGSGR